MKIAVPRLRQIDAVAASSTFNGCGYHATRDGGSARYGCLGGGCDTLHVLPGSMDALRNRISHTTENGESSAAYSKRV